jgi:hypothetical protein
MDIDKAVQELEAEASGQKLGIQELIEVLDSSAVGLRQGELEIVSA